MIMYLLIEFEPTKNFNQKSDLFIRKPQQILDNCVWEFSGIFFL
jgi:hypothetical protein